MAELASADVLIGHNILDYDIPVLQRIYGLETKAKLFDTLVAARLLWPDAKNNPHGGNGVDDFAKLFGMKKVGKDIEDWSEWTPLMEKRCINDTDVQHRIFDYIKGRAKKFPGALRIEHAVASLISWQTDNGVRIDVAGAEKMAEYMEVEMASALDSLHEAFPPLIETMKTHWWVDPSTGKQYGTKKGAPKEIQRWLEKGPAKTKEHPFNPGSSQQIADRFLAKYGWKAPTTEAGNPSVTEDILTGIDFEEAGLLLKYQMADKRLQHLTDWITRARECRTPGVIHPRINTNGAATGRATHQQPNQTACPKVVVGPDGPIMGYPGRYGYEMRSLWIPTQRGWVMVGGDASGLELRMLGAALARWDGGEYARVVVSGDIHTFNMEAGGLDTRDQSKTTIYAFLYGAGDEKIGTTIADHPSLSPDQREKYKGKSRKKIGRQFRDRFGENLSAMRYLVDWCQQGAAGLGYVVLLDGRRAPVRSAHSALNTKLQGDGAVLMKLSMICFHAQLQDLREKRLYAPMLWPHDEFQCESHPEHAERVGQAIPTAIKEAGKRLSVQCELDGEYKIGANWAETH